MRPSPYRFAALLALVCLGTGCAGGYLRQTSDIREAYEASEYEKAIALFAREEKQIRSDDRLLFLLDKGMVLHSAGKFDESIQVLTEADRLSQQLDVVSVSEEASTLLSNEAERAYRGESFEKLMISVLQALNYASLDKDEDALVEVRRVNERLRKMVVDEKKPYQQLAIARYLSGVLYEDQRQYDDAFLDYKAAYTLQPALGDLANALVRTARLAGREDELKELKGVFPQADESKLAPDEGEVLVVVEAGLSPEKHTSNEREPVRYDSNGKAIGGNLIAVPVYEDRWTNKSATVALNGIQHRTVVITDLETVSRIDLQDRVGKMMLKSMASTAVKAGIAAGAGAATKSEAVGVLTFLILSLSNQADTRSWLSLPAEFQLARVKLPAGEQQVVVQYGGSTETYPVKVRPGRITVLPVRRY